MGKGGWFLFGEEDVILIDEIAKLHNIPKDKKEVVKKHYKNMIEAIENEIQD